MPPVCLKASPLHLLKTPASCHRVCIVWHVNNLPMFLHWGRIVPDRLHIVESSTAWCGHNCTAFYISVVLCILTIGGISSNCRVLTNTSGLLLKLLPQMLQESGLCFMISTTGCYTQEWCLHAPVAPCFLNGGQL